MNQVKPSVRFAIGAHVRLVTDALPDVTDEAEQAFIRDERLVGVMVGCTAWGWLTVDFGKMGEHVYAADVLEEADEDE